MIAPSFKIDVRCVSLTLPKQVLIFTCLQYKSFENTRAISPFSTVFSIHFGNFLLYSSKLKLSSANSFGLEESKICRLRKG